MDVANFLFGPTGNEQWSPFVRALRDGGGAIFLSTLLGFFVAQVAVSLPWEELQIALTTHWLLHSTLFGIALTVLMASWWYRWVCEKKITAARKEQERSVHRYGARPTFSPEVERLKGRATLMFLPLCLVPLIYISITYLIASVQIGG